MSGQTNDFPKVHNATWPGVVGKEGPPDAEPHIELDTMIEMTAKAEVNGVKFDGIDLFLASPHVDIDSSDDDLKKLADKLKSHSLVVGSVVAPVWPPVGGGAAIDPGEGRQKFVEMVGKAARIASKLTDLGVRPYGVIRIDSATDVASWAKDPETNQKNSAETYRQACQVAADQGQKLSAEGEICWGGLHSWKRMVQLLEMVDQPQTLGFQADMAHTLLYLMGYNAPEDAILPADFDWQDPKVLDEGLKKLTDALRPWTNDFHVAQNDATVFGSGSHDKTGRHCLPNDPNGKLEIARHAGYWLRDSAGELTKSVSHICWDGCMFPNETMRDQKTWDNVLAAMLAVREAHGWSGAAASAGSQS
jgi:sugar phosphate isomerase/epimerase